MLELESEKKFVVAHASLFLLYNPLPPNHPLYSLHTYIDTKCKSSCPLSLFCCCWWCLESAKKVCRAFFGTKKNRHTHKRMCLENFPSIPITIIIYTHMVFYLCLLPISFTPLRFLEFFLLLISLRHCRRRLRILVV